MAPTDGQPREQLTLAISGMHCAACATRLQAGLRAIEGVEEASVNFATQRALVVLATDRDGAFQGRPARQRLVRAVQDLGFDAAPPDSAGTGGPAAPEHEARLRRELVVSAAFTVPLVVLAMSHGWARQVLGWSPRAEAMVQCALVLPVVFVGGRSIFASAWAAARHASATMHTLVALGVLASMVASVRSLVLMMDSPAAHDHGAGDHPLYFEAAAVIITFVLLGRLLEARSRSRAGDAVASLLALQPAQAQRLDAGGHVREVPVSQIRPGDALLVRPGQRVPVDGVVLDEPATLDESLISGESMPVERRPGETVLAGVLATATALRLRATSDGAATALHRMAALVEQAQAQQPPIARLADRVSARFTWGVLVLALVTFAGWMLLGEPATRLHMAITTSVAVLVVACPCALGLATPVGVLVATGRAAREGLLFRDGGAAMERAARTDVVLLDKTGTLTLGRPDVVSITPTGSWPVQEALRLAASAEQPSEHPLARAIVSHAVGKGLVLAQPRAFAATPGVGVRALVEGHDVRLRRVEAQALPPELAPDMPPSATLVGVHIDGSPAAIIALADTPHPRAAHALAELRALGVDSMLLTGDQPGPAQALASQLGISSVQAGASPADKLTRVRALQQRGKRIAMVGDGVNDAAALAQADVGMAMGAGTDAAIASAAITLLHHDPAQIPRAIALSRRTMTIIRQNLAWAFGYNLLMLPLATGVMYPWTGWLLSPMIASLAMSLSSVSVVLNSLRLRRD